MHVYAYVISYPFYNLFMMYDMMEFGNDWYCCNEFCTEMICPVTFYDMK